MKKNLRKRYRKMFVHNNPNDCIKSRKRELIKGEYVTSYKFFKYNHISRLLWGKCLVFEGIEQSGWYPRKNDLIIVTETHLSRNDIRKLNIIANSIGKELFVEFSWGPKGIGSIILSIFIEAFTKEVLKELFKKIFEEKKHFIIKHINIKIIKNKQYLEIIDINDNIYEFIARENVNELEQNVFNTIELLNIPYTSEELDKSKNVYDRYGSKIDYDIAGKTIDIKI